MADSAEVHRALRWGGGYSSVDFGAANQVEGLSCRASVALELLVVRVEVRREVNLEGRIRWGPAGELLQVAGAGEPKERCTNYDRLAWVASL